MAKMLAENLKRIQARIASACETFGIAPTQVKLLAVSKTFNAERVREAYSCGLIAFGENYVQEGLEKIAALSDLRSEITWHFIGPLQSNKTKDVAEHFDWMHTVDREKIARRLSDQRPAQLAPLRVCIQVNISAEDSKSGLPPDEVFSLASIIAALPGLCLRGLMAIPEPSTDPDLQRHQFRQLAALFEQTRAMLPVHAQADFDTLSMGMSDDLEAAIAESRPNATTLLRVGSALFGRRGKGVNDL